MQDSSEADQEILSRLREPIGELVERYCAEKTDYQKLRLRQLAWQALDVLARTGNVSFIKDDRNIQRIIKDIKEVGASEEFIQESLALAISIYREMEVNHPNLLRRYQGKK